jgi:hypothetical protein
MPKPDRSSVTLDEAIEAFEACQNNKTCGTLLLAGTQYHKDEMIGDLTFRCEVLKPCIDYLLKDRRDANA